MAITVCGPTPNRHRVLCLDAGGMRAVLSLGVLRELERELRRVHRDPALTLGHFFDRIAGSSAGAVIAAGLALGMTVENVQRHFDRFGGRIFARRRWNPLRSVYCEQPLEEEIERLVGATRASDAALVCGLLVFCKRAETNTTECFSSTSGDELPLRDVLRASCSVPAYFPPKRLEGNGGSPHVYIDGGVGTAHDPALPALLHILDAASVDGIQADPEHLLLVSVGTGHWPADHESHELERRWSGGWLQAMPSMVLEETARHNRRILRSVSRCLAWFGEEWPGDRGPARLDRPLLSYVRYDVELVRSKLEALGLGDLDGDLRALRATNCAGSRGKLHRIGCAAGRAMVRAHHIPEAFRLSSLARVSW